MVVQLRVTPGRTAAITQPHHRPMGCSRLVRWCPAGWNLILAQSQGTI